MLETHPLQEPALHLIEELCDLVSALSHSHKALLKAYVADHHHETAMPPK
jgi:hypothetical protein